MIGALVLTVALSAGQDLLEEARRLQGEERFVEALAVLDEVEDAANAGLQRALCLWTAGDLGGALLAALEGLEAGGDGETRRHLLWQATGLALELGEADLALDLVTRMERAIAGATDLTDVERGVWRTGTSAAGGGAEELSGRLDAAATGVTLARAVGALFATLAVAAVFALGRR